MVYFKKYLNLLVILLILSGCKSLPGINQSPVKQEKSKKIASNQFSINDVKINLILLNKLSENEIEKINRNKITDISYQIKNYPNIYNYKYDYILVQLMLFQLI